jgi:hypothetical protein
MRAASLPKERQGYTAAVAWGNAGTMQNTHGWVVVEKNPGKPVVCRDFVRK